MTFSERLALLEGVAIPVWIIDYANLEMLWGNSRALALWQARDLADLQGRDFKQVSASARTRQLATLARIERGETEERLLTFYPHGKSAVTVRCHFSGIELDDGRTVTLVQAMDSKVDIDPEQLRGIEAIRRIWAIVSLLDEAGAVLTQNPAGLRAFGEAAALRDWFVDPAMADTVDAEVKAARIFRGEVKVRTLAGERWHAVEAHRSVDPVSGAPATLVLQMDVTALHESRARIEQQAAQIRVMSVPILDVGQGALAVPLIGVLDEERSSELAGRLLPEITTRRAANVILDLTGVETLDAAGATSVLKVVRAVELLGARPILTGIRPQLAELLVRSGVNLGGILTLRTLASGLAACRAR
ncbi:MAG TPA: STAS domain-containing protein [Pseudomonadota bacterium]|nr:STAS domain-containing protein [Pseudomonadota bacterium]